MVLLAGLLPGLLSTAPALAQQPAAPAAAAKPTTPAAPAAAAKPPVAINPQTAALAEKAIGLAQKDQYEEALKLFRDAYRIDRNPRWLYNVGVLYDRMANCDEAAFFYRAALFGQGVLPQDVDLVDNRLGVLQEECNFRERHKQVADRHARATRYMSPEFRLCALAESILTGIMTPQERQQLATCKATENTPSP
ncbi:MAG TPA: tetratricopeptide repeat protein [Pseudomonadota bacterium]|nr:tetratricopeptide repeat protein [Pseudomonadota bacterium]HNK44949.1 tetratricopeptide repeat protein [Pseudomonadota bacterium]HNN54300.1 tetratricopeptide repeat protein [Pseudomonadota bacterium]